MSEVAIDGEAPAGEDAGGPTTGRVLDHAYDGIREYDNPLPGWWRAIFLGSFIFALVYFYVFSIGHLATTPQEKYHAEELAWIATHEEESTSIAASSEAELTTGSHDEAMVERGRGIFQEKCASCHTPDGRGLIGPNLTDLFQIHGTTREDLYNTIRDGAPGTAMMAWGTQLRATDLLAAAAFVSSLRGKNTPGKEPQGKPVPAFTR